MSLAYHRYERFDISGIWGLTLCYIIYKLQGTQESNRLKMAHLDKVINCHKCTMHCPFKTMNSIYSCWRGVCAVLLCIFSVNTVVEYTHWSPFCQTIQCSLLCSSPAPCMCIQCKAVVSVAVQSVHMIEMLLFEYFLRTSM